MKTVEKGNTVLVHYVGKLLDGTIFDDSNGKDPLKFTVGENQVIEGFDEAVLGLKVNDNKTVQIPKEKGYGEIDENLIFDLPTSSFPKEIELHTGSEIVLSNPEGEELLAYIKKFDENIVTLDANHPLSGKDLIFEIKLVEIL